MIIFSMSALHVSFMVPFYKEEEGKEIDVKKILATNMGNSGKWGMAPLH